jgi:MoxR-like ATPase
MAAMHDTELSPSVLGGARDLAQAVLTEVSRAYLGPPAITDALLTAVVARGHVLVEGIPGIAKTTLVKAFAAAMGCSFRRIQFTPDLLPADITGTYILDMRTSEFVLHAGPIFANVVLGDEINRAPAKTQSALLEAMQERQVTIDGDTRPLDAPFTVLATQNPLEHDGTYPLPDAQVDRFLLKLRLGYPSEDDELRMLATYGGDPPAASAVLSQHDVIHLQALADRVHAEVDILEYILAIVRFTRQHPRTYLGASPRAALALLRACKARALLRGRGYVLPDEVKALAPLVLAHRITLAADAELDGAQADAIVDEALRAVSYKRQHSPAGA